MPAQTETLIFLHIPKVGGMTLYKILERQYSRFQTLTFDGGDAQKTRFKRLPVAERGRYRLIRGHLYFGLHRLTRCFFGFPNLQIAKVASREVQKSGRSSLNVRSN
jgi:hypothetical protein